MKIAVIVDTEERYNKFVKKVGIKNIDELSDFFKKQYPYMVKNDFDDKNEPWGSTGNNWIEINEIIPIPLEKFLS